MWSLSKRIHSCTDPSPVTNPQSESSRPAILRRRLGLWLILPLGFGACRDAETALARGDRLWADSNYVGALAEYRLSYELRRDDDQILARVAHA